MMKVTEVAFSAYPVTDLPRARAFYEGVLGLQAEPIKNPHWIEYKIGEHYLGIGRAEGWKPSSDGCSVALEVEDFDAAVATLREANVRFRMEPFPTPVCRMAMVFDPDGNTIVIHKRKT
jgi:predicted enzyme related to lactoylglutathione lyase